MKTFNDYYKIFLQETYGLNFFKYAILLNLSIIILIIGILCAAVAYIQSTISQTSQSLIKNHSDTTTTTTITNIT